MYINGNLQDNRYYKWMHFAGKDLTKKPLVETLFFPLSKVGGFIGKIDELKIWNKVLSDKIDKF